MHYVGIDFGVKGGIAVVDHNGVIVAKHVMPVTKDNEIDVYELGNIFTTIFLHYEPLKIQGEKLHAIFGSSAKATFKFGHDYGVVKTTAMGVLGEVKLVRAVDWQKRIFDKLKVEKVKKANSSRNDTKTMALHAALKLWPNENWLPSKRHRVVHNGMIDAALIAYDLKEQ